MLEVRNRAPRVEGKKTPNDEQDFGENVQCTPFGMKEPRIDLFDNDNQNEQHPITQPKTHLLVFFFSAWQEK